MTVAYVTEEVNLVSASKQGCGNTVHWCISPTLIVESAFRFQVVKEFGISLASLEIHVCDFKVTPVVTKVI